MGLRCRECGTEYELQATHVCEMCFGPLDAVYDEAALKKVVSRQRIERKHDAESPRRQKRIFRLTSG